MCREGVKMETFRMISATACFLGITLSVFGRMYPSEKFGKQMKTIISLIFLISVLKPVVKGELQLPDISETVTASSSYYQSISENTDEYFISAMENNISARLKTTLSENNYFSEEIHTNINISDDNSIFISEVIVLVQNDDCSDEIKKCITENVGENATVIVKMKEGQYEH